MGVGLTKSPSARWQVVGASVAGSGHRARGVGCDDACAYTVDDRGDALIVAGDGAGSARAGERGARVAVAVAFDALLRGAAPADAMLLARAAVEDVAGADGVPLGELATTLLVVRAGEHEVEFAQLGDGAVVVRAGRGYDVPAPDDKGEYLNETTFLTSSSWRLAMRTGSFGCTDQIDGVAVLTDGLHLLGFDLMSGQPHRPFFDPFFSFAAGGGAVPELEAFLGSARVGDRTDDDVTLVVAARA